jgi:ribonuclease HI
VITVNFDGACEPKNPGGFASYGLVILRDGERIFEDSCLFDPFKLKGRTSNNLAEYSGFLAGLKFLISKGLQQEEILVCGDSKLVIEQMFGTWRIKKGFYVDLALEARHLLKKFTRITGRWIPREENSLADELSKRVLKKANVRFKIQPEGP